MFGANDRVTIAAMQAATELGRQAVQTLLNRVQMPTLPPTVTALRTRLIERQSVKDIRQSVASINFG